MAIKTRVVLKWVAIAIFVVLFSWGIYNQSAKAGEVRLGLAMAFTNDDDWIGQEVMFMHKDWYGSVMRVGGDNVLPDTVRLAIGYRVEWREGKKVSPYMRMGGAYFMDEPTDIISDRWAYDMALGVRLYGVTDLEYQHNSTAGRSLQNSGNDMPMIGLVVKF